MKGLFYLVVTMVVIIAHVQMKSLMLIQKLRRKKLKQRLHH